MIRFLFQQSIPKRIAASFAIVILVGSLLLNLPISHILIICLRQFLWFV